MDEAKYKGKDLIWKDGTIVFKMPITTSALKKLRQDKVRNLANNKVRSSLRAAVKAFRLKKNESLLGKAFSALDKAVKKRVIHQNKAARLKSKLARWLR
ncbi:MAG: 30S ribosomal protein S20 [Patescibacteria group bacterium]